MIDVVFLLIIFFLVSSHLARQEVQAHVDLPVADSGTEPGETRDYRVTINVKREGGSFAIKFGSEPVNPSDLLLRITNIRNNVGPKIEVRIRADRLLPYAAVEPIMLACARAGVWNVTFAVIRHRDASR